MYVCVYVYALVYVRMHSMHVCICMIYGAFILKYVAFINQDFDNFYERVYFHSAFERSIDLTKADEKRLQIDRFRYSLLYRQLPSSFNDQECYCVIKEEMSSLFSCEATRLKHANAKK